MDESGLNRIREAFEEHGAAVHGYIRHISRRSRLTPANADDIYGEVALVACQKAARGTGAVPEKEWVLPWLMRIALYTTLNVARKEHRTVSADVEDVIAEDQVLRTVEEDSANARLDLESFMANLDEADRQLIRELIREGKTSTEIAAERGTTAAAVRQKKSRLLKALRVHLRLPKEKP